MARTAGKGRHSPSQVINEMQIKTNDMPFFSPIELSGFFLKMLVHDAESLRKQVISGTGDRSIFCYVLPRRQLEIKIVSF